MIKKTILSGGLSLLLSGASQAAVGIDWKSTGALSAGESAIDTTGAVLYAYNLGDETGFNINSVNFRGTTGGANPDLGRQGNVLFTPPDSGASARFSNLDGDFGSLMNSASWGFGNANTTITLNNLVAGESYTVQIFSSDTRNGRNNVVVLDSGTQNEFSSAETGAANQGAQVTGTFVADATEQATFTFRYLSNSGNANLNAIQVRKAPREWVQPGLPYTIEALDAIKANLDVEPWKTGYEEMLDAPQSSLEYTMQGPFEELGRRENNREFESDMQAVHNMARLWYFTGEEQYAQKGRDILVAWARVHKTLLPGEVYLVIGYNAYRIFEGADILRSTWPGWTQADTDVCKDYFGNVLWDVTHLAVPNPLRSANQGQAQLAAAVGIAIFNEDDQKFEEVLHAFRTDAGSALPSSLPNGQIGDSGRDAHDQGQLLLLARSAEAFWAQGVDVYSEMDNRLLADAEFISRYNLLLDTPFIQAGTVYDVYPEAHHLESEFDTYSIETSMINLLYSAYVERAGMRAPYLEAYKTFTTNTADSFCYLKPPGTDTSSATLSPPLPDKPEVASVTSLQSANVGDANGGGQSYSNGTWTIQGRGTRLSQNSDPDYHFAYLPVTGDATIIAKLTSISGGSTDDARAGLVFTQNFEDGNSPTQAFVISGPDGDDPELYSFFRGDAANAHANANGVRTYLSMPDPKVPYWLKIERIGDRVTSYSSPDGISWAANENADYNIGENAFMGLAVSADRNDRTATATFTNVRITGGDGGEAAQVPAPPFAIYASPGGDAVPLRWLESFEADSYKIRRSTREAGPYTVITEQTGTSYIDTDVVFGTRYYYTVSAVNAIGESAPSPPDAIQYVDADFYEAEDYDDQRGLGTESARDFFGGRNLSNINTGNWASYNDIPIRSGAVFEARIASFDEDFGNIEVRIDSPTGRLIGTLVPIFTNGAQSWGTADTNLDVATGVYDVYLVFTAAADGSGPSINLNWFNLLYPDLNKFDLGQVESVTYDPEADILSNLGLITDLDSTFSHLALNDGSDFTDFDFVDLGLRSWRTAAFGNPSITTEWDGANLSGITLYTDGSFGAGDTFTGANFTNVVWGSDTSTADPALFFSRGAGATSAADSDEALDLSGADLSKITGTARDVLIANLGGFDGTTPIGARFDSAFVAKSGFSQSTLLEAGWQFTSILFVDTARFDASDPPTLSNSDLAQTHLLSSEGPDATARLFDGDLGNTDGIVDDGEIALHRGDSVKITFDTSINSLGYDLTGITTYFGWNTSGNGRANQGYLVSVEYVDGTTAVLVEPHHWEPNLPASYWTQVSLSSGGGVLTSNTVVLNGESFPGTNVTASGVKSVTFEITESANAQGVVFAREFDIFGTPVPLVFSDVELWRFRNFGTYDNTGDTADGADFDRDGLSNFLEYAIGSDPTESTPAPLRTAPSASGDGFDISFNRIDDPTITYSIQGSTTLASDDWTNIYQIDGLANDTVTVPESVVEGRDRYFYRLQISQD